MTGPDVLSGDLQLYQKPREACLGPLWIQWPWTVIFRSSEKRSPSRHFQSEWQSLFLVVKKWMQNLKDLLPCWLPLRYTRWKLAKIAKKDHVSWVILKKKINGMSLYVIQKEALYCYHHPNGQYPRAGRRDLTSKFEECLPLLRNRSIKNLCKLVECVFTDDQENRE